MAFEEKELITPNFSWNGQHVKDLAFNALWDNLKRATLFLHQQIVEVTLAKPNPGKRIKQGRRSFTVYDSPSKPGEPPRARTSWLRKHVGYEFSKEDRATRVGIGANALYGLFLEFGVKGGKTITAKAGKKALAFWSGREQRIIFRKKVTQGAIKARPWLLATVQRVWPQLSAIAGGRNGP